MHVSSIHNGTRTPALVWMGQEGEQTKCHHSIETEVKSHLSQESHGEVQQPKRQLDVGTCGGINKRKPVILAVSIMAQVPACPVHCCYLPAPVWHTFNLISPLSIHLKLLPQLRKLTGKKSVCDHQLPKPRCWALLTPLKAETHHHFSHF